MKEIYVIGHKNPDTDSICSAICYARLKNIVTGTNDYLGIIGNVIGEEYLKEKKKNDR